MQFLMDNYIWFLVAGIIGLMTVIGYIAEKTDFGRKEVKREESKEKKVKKDVKKIEELKLNDVVYSDNNKNIEVVDVNKVEEPDVFAFNDLNVSQPEEDLTVPLNDEKKVSEANINLNVEEDLTVPLNDNKQNEIANNFMEEDLTVPLSGKVEEIKEEVNVNVDEDLTVPLNAESNVKNESLVQEIDENKKENTDISSAEDIWKF